MGRAGPTHSGRAGAPGPGRAGRPANCGPRALIRARAVSPDSSRSLSHPAPPPPALAWELSPGRSRCEAARRLVLGSGPARPGGAANDGRGDAQPAGRAPARSKASDSVAAGIASRTDSSPPSGAPGAAPSGGHRDPGGGGAGGAGAAEGGLAGAEEALLVAHDGARADDAEPGRGLAGGEAAEALGEEEEAVDGGGGRGGAVGEGELDDGDAAVLQLRGVVLRLLEADDGGDVELVKGVDVVDGAEVAAPSWLIEPLRARGVDLGPLNATNLLGTTWCRSALSGLS
jgi:hypothetical protein